MNPVSHLNEVQVLNLMHLSTIRMALVTDPISASYRFALTTELVTYLTAAPPDTLQMLVCALRQTSLFIPRPNFIDVCTSPPALLPTLGAARAHLPGRDPGLPERRGQQS